ncbi:hypothetical protein [Escherichia coli]|uniref:hypothetical protein n=1 Tax=Escherichia coli TaxID=562 RepID=UPI000E212685|nr:hypothetical protein [Escherichia coli]
MSEWIYDQTKCVTDYEGFVYKITNTVTGRKYIGRKYVYSRHKGKPPKEAKWRSYWGSCKELLADIKLLGEDKFKREIIHLCETRKDTNFLEVEEQFKREVLRAKLPDGTRAYYNGNIMSRFFVPSPEARERAGKKSAITLKKLRDDPNYVHPMKGKKHPNGGKKISSGHKKNAGLKSITDGVKNERLRLDGDVSLLPGWRFGLSVKKKRKPSEARLQYVPKKCETCGADMPFEQREWQTCSDKCRCALISARNKGRLLAPKESLKAAGQRQKEKTAIKYGFESYEKLRGAIITLRETGLSYTNIAKQIGCSKSLANSIVMN